MLCAYHMRLQRHVRRARRGRAGGMPCAPSACALCHSRTQNGYAHTHAHTHYTMSTECLGAVTITSPAFRVLVATAPRMPLISPTCHPHAYANTRSQPPQAPPTRANTHVHVHTCRCARTRARTLSECLVNSQRKYLVEMEQRKKERRGMLEGGASGCGSMIEEPRTIASERCWGRTQRFRKHCISVTRVGADGLLSSGAPECFRQRSAASRVRPEALQSHLPMQALAQ